MTTTSFVHVDAPKPDDLAPKVRAVIAAWEAAGWQMRGTPTVVASTIMRRSNDMPTTVYLTFENENGGTPPKHLTNGR